MTKIAILSGTDRPNANALVVSNYLKNAYNKEQDVEAYIVDLKDFPLEAVIGGNYGKENPKLEAFNKQFLAADGVVMVVPEYNGGFPGILKLFIDYLPFPSAFAGLPMAFVGEASGSFGALRSVEQLQMVAAYRNAYLFPERLFINQVHKNFDPENGPLNELQNELMGKQVINFVNFVKRLTN